MSVQSLRGRLTDQQAEFDRTRKSYKSLILVSPLPVLASGLVPGTIGSHDFELELTVGTRWGNFLLSPRPQLVDVAEQPILIGPNDSVVIEVEQTLSVPNNAFGVVFPKSALVHRSGLAPLTTKIDPTYSGKPLILVWNLGPTKKTLAPGDPLVSVSFFSLDETLDVPRHDRPPLETGGSLVRKAMQRKMLLNSAVWAGAVSGIIAAIVTVLLAHL